MRLIQLTEVVKRIINKKEIKKYYELLQLLLF